MRITLLVVEHGALLNGFLSNAKVDGDHAIVIFRRAFHCELKRVEQAARVTSRHIDEMGRGLSADLYMTVAIATLFVVQRSQ